MFTNVIRTAALSVAAVAMVTVMSSDANAQSCRYGGGYGGFGVGGSGFSLSIGSGYGGYGGYYGGFNRGININTYRPTYYRRPAVWHDTSHFDYHRGRLVPHGDHLDYIPGHWSLHRTGHWHR